MRIWVWFIFGTNLDLISCHVPAAVSQYTTPRPDFGSRRKRLKTELYYNKESCLRCFVQPFCNAGFRRQIQCRRHKTPINE